MRPQFVLIVLGFLLFTASALGTTKLHAVNFGKWTSIQVVRWSKRRQVS
jgi:hypothetical protein